MIRICKLFLVFCLVFVASAQTMAKDIFSNGQEQQKYVNIRLLPEHTKIRANQEIWVGIEQSIAPDWHTYWKNPGDSGSAPRIQWTLPEGFTIGEIQWPAPKKLPYGPLLNYGYEDQVILLQKLKAPDKLTEEPVTLKAAIDILVCKEECIPEYSEHTITLNDPAIGEENNSAFLEKARERLPKTQLSWSFDFHENEEKLVLTVRGIEPSIIESMDPAHIFFIPEDWGFVDNVAVPINQIKDGHLVIEQKRGDRDLDDTKSIKGVLSYKTNQSADLQTVSFEAQKSNSVSEPGPSGSLIGAFIFALLGGVILNLMPCVFPVLSIKALSLVKIADKHPDQARIHGIAYTLGVVLSFVLIAGVLIILKNAGAGIGWGFQLQNPIVVGLLAYLLFIIGLNLSGVFDIGNAFSNVGGKWVQGHGYANSFITGILATLVATPCTAPFMGVAIGFALLQPAAISLLIFATLGFGLALPYLLLSLWPKLQRILPKPGPWMVHFKELLAFPMYASAAWLIWVLSQQAGHMGTLAILMGLVAISFAFWLLSHRPQKKMPKLIFIFLAILSFAFALFSLPREAIKSPILKNHSQESFGEVFSERALEEALKTNDPIFVEMTAAWCITCKVNHAAAINIEETKALFARNNVRFLIGDWTNQDPEITKYLNRYGRNGVPIYVFYGSPDDQGIRPEPKVLPQILTPAVVKEFVEGKNN